MAIELRGSRKSARRITAAVAAAVVAVSMSACSSGSGASSDASHPSGTLQIMVSSADASDAAFRAVNKSFEKKYPDVNVKFSTVSNDNYPASLSSRLSAKNVDIFVLKDFSAPPKYAKEAEPDNLRLIKAGGVLDLTDQPFMKKYSKSVQKSQAVDGKQYVVPTGLSYTTGLYYNKKIFKKYDLKPPRTFKQLMKVSATLKKHGVTPFGIGAKEGWPAGLPMLSAVQSLYPTAQSQDALTRALWQQKTKLTDKKPLEVLKRTNKVYGYAQKNFAGASYENIPAGFGAGKYAMTPDGTWNNTVIAKAVGNKFDFGYIPAPMGDTAKSNDLLGGKVELQLGVSAATKNKTAALAWMKFFSQAHNYKTFLKKSGFASAEPGVQASAFYKSIAPYIKTFQSGWAHHWFPNNDAGQAAVYPFNYPGLKPIGSGTPGQAAAAAQKAWGAAF